MTGVVVGFDLLLFPRVPLRYALPRRLLMAFSLSRRGGWRIRPPPGSRPTPSERQRKEKLAGSFTASSFRRSGYAGAQFFEEPGSAQGRRGSQHQAGRFARPSYFSEFAPQVQVPAPGAFSLPPGAAHSLFGAAKREWGAHPHGAPALLSRPGKTAKPGQRLIAGFSVRPSR